MACGNKPKSVSPGELQGRVEVLKNQVAALGEALNNPALSPSTHGSEGNPFNSELINEVTDYIKLWWCSSSEERRAMIEKRRTMDRDTLKILEWNYEFQTGDFAESIMIAGELLENTRDDNTHGSLWVAMMVLEIRSFCESFNNLQGIVLANKLNSPIPVAELETPESPYRRNLFLGGTLLMLQADRKEFALLPEEHVRIESLRIREKSEPIQLPALEEKDIQIMLSKSAEITDEEFISLWNRMEYKLLVQIATERIKTSKEDLGVLYVLIAACVMVDDTELLHSAGETMLNAMRRYPDIRIRAWRDLNNEIYKYAIAKDVSEHTRQAFRSQLSSESKFQDTFQYLRKIEMEYDPVPESEIEKLHL